MASTHVRTRRVALGRRTAGGSHPARRAAAHEGRCADVTLGWRALIWQAAHERAWHPRGGARDVIGVLTTSGLP